ncbi:secreted immunoglobulin domain 1 [Sebastes fasciatus]|uniref:secreted immunoglobulin domain 1 n=1 Tax=Sebastes fasciatus TaxID=394691 RepID=UPI003D9ED7B1
MMMMMKMVCVILLSISGLWWEQHAAALPTSTVQVRVGEDVILQCPLLDASTVNASTVNASTVNASSANASTVNASTANASTVNASTVNASTVNASTANTSSANASTVNASSANASNANASTANASTSNASTANASTANASTTLSWYRQAAGQRPELLLSFRSTNASQVKYGAGVGPNKVSAASDGSLLLHDFKRNDSAVYYCSITQGDEQKKNPPPKDVMGS